MSSTNAIDKKIFDICKKLACVGSRGFRRIVLVINMLSAPALTLFPSHLLSYKASKSYKTIRIHSQDLYELARASYSQRSMEGKILGATLSHLSNDESMKSADPVSTYPCDSSGCLSHV